MEDCRKFESANNSYGQIQKGEADARLVVRPPLTATHPRVTPTSPPAEANYPSELEHDVVSGGSLRYHVRPIRPDDGPRLVAFHHHLLPRSVFLRFFTFHPELSSKEVEHFTCVDYVNRLALVAEIDDRLIAVGRYDSAPGETEAEVAFVVSDEFQHHGIGALLLDELARAAWERGITTFRAETLCENRAMLDVFRHAGFPVTFECRVRNGDPPLSHRANGRLSSGPGRPRGLAPMERNVAGDPP